MTTDRTGTIEGWRRAIALGLSDRLSLLASPTFAIMALLTGILSVGEPDMLCTTAPTSPLTGMVAMYGLMSAFHAGPWLRLIADGRSSAHRP
ncbi:MULTISPECIES: hypothetical protein [unclassified Ensifer]|uniref:hypothetical protein n=1 Tax=unclassified Ensifer TaxID=2633371 RepID=UPI000813C234|nr:MULTISPECIES: hypothetical protein [unclassified Ensifer]OCP23124.1 hypothetical protein BC361_23150 [Ensifer sp. LC54]OCP24952.1 hypothetical protein BC363_21330 [Ensifer sp. LC384]